MKHVCKHLRRQRPHVRAAVDYLKALGAEAIEVLQNRCLRLRWRFAGRTFAISLAVASHPGPHALELATQAIRRVLRGAGFPVPALAAGARP